jgi:hypothetical protein
MNLPVHPDSFLTEKIMETIPVRPLEDPVGWPEYASRLAQIYRLLDIDAVADERGGIEFVGGGVGLEDQPLVGALQSLVMRRLDPQR